MEIKLKHRVKFFVSTKATLAEERANDFLEALSVKWDYLKERYPEEYSQIEGNSRAAYPPQAEIRPMMSYADKITMVGCMIEYLDYEVGDGDSTDSFN